MVITLRGYRNIMTDIQNRASTFFNHIFHNFLVFANHFRITLCIDHRYLFNISIITSNIIFYPSYHFLRRSVDHSDYLLVSIRKYISYLLKKNALTSQTYIMHLHCGRRKHPFGVQKMNVFFPVIITVTFLFRTNFLLFYIFLVLHPSLYLPYMLLCVFSSHLSGLISLRTPFFYTRSALTFYL